MSLRAHMPNRRKSHSSLAEAPTLMTVDQESKICLTNEVSRLTVC